MTRPKAPKTKTTPGQSPPTSPMPGSRKRGADAGSPAKDKAAAEVVDLEKRRLAVAEELRHVEQQVLVSNRCLFAAYFFCWWLASLLRFAS